MLTIPTETSKYSVNMLGTRRIQKRMETNPGKSVTLSSENQNQNLPKYGNSSDINTKTVLSLVL